MLDWKILASVFIALLVVSFILLEGFGIGNFLSGTVNAISDWFGSSPFGDLISKPKAGSKHVNVTIYPSNLTIKPDGEVSIETESINFAGFEGSIEMDFKNKTVLLSESKTQLKVTIPTGTVKISNLKLGEISLESVKFTIEPNITTTNGTINIHEFSGSATIGEGFELSGNVSELYVKIGELELEIK